MKTIYLWYDDEYHQLIELPEQPESEMPIGTRKCEMSDKEGLEFLVIQDQARTYNVLKRDLYDKGKVL